MAWDNGADKKRGNIWDMSLWNYLCMKIMVMLYNGSCSDQASALWYLLTEHESRVIFKLGQLKKRLGK